MRLETAIVSRPIRSILPHAPNSSFAAADTRKHANTSERRLRSRVTLWSVASSINASAPPHAAIFLALSIFFSCEKYTDTQLYVAHKTPAPEKIYRLSQGL